MHNKSLPKLARKYFPYKDRIPPAPEVNLSARSWPAPMFCGVYYSLDESALSLYAINSVCSVQFFVRDHQEPGYLCPPVTQALPEQNHRAQETNSHLQL